ncbi:MAG: hypothetical protein V2J24_16525 [Pseudomonadales bacterium]|jgi:hypothetical protein|nr:hypothetical protein [Pseudomonadales bacterium]
MRARLFFLALAFAASPTLAADTPCAEAGTLEDARFIPDVREAALAVARVQCAEDATQAELTAAFKNFVRGSAGWFDPFGGFADGRRPMVFIAGNFDVYGDAGLPAIGLSLNDELSIGDQFFAPADEARCEAQAGGAPCGAVLDEFGTLYDYAQRAYARGARQQFVEDVREMSAEWDRFLTTSRAFSPLELALNSWLQRRNEGDAFERPPDRQWILLHPSFAIENVDDAVGGEQAQAALVIDVLGVNWWRQDRWYLPTGIAASYVYSDRPGVQNWGYGASVYFDSVYTVGYSNHDGDHGLYVTADLLKLFQDTLGDYRRWVGQR